MYNTVVDGPSEVADSPIGCNSPTPAVAPSGKAVPWLLTKTFMMNSPTFAVAPKVNAPPSWSKKPSEGSPTTGIAPLGGAAPCLPPKTFAKLPKPAVAPPPFHKPPDDNAMPLHREEHELSARTFVWLMVENIPPTQQTQSLGFKNNDILRWLDYEPKYLESEPPPLPARRFLDCETWSGQLVVVPSEYVRPISSTLELAQVLQRMPRARVIKDFVGAGDDDLSVEAGEVIYLLFECDSTYFMAMNKSSTRGRVPKSVLTVLVAP